LFSWPGKLCIYIVQILVVFLTPKQGQKK
jgi:hypothetical protein